MKGRLQESSLSILQNAEKNRERLKPRTSRSRTEILYLERALGSLEQSSSLSTDELIGILQQCRKEKSLENGLRCYAYLCKHGLEVHQSLGNYLVPMLVDIGCMNYAEEVFYRLPCRNVYSWNAFLSGCVNHGRAQHALASYKRMQDDSLYPGVHTYIALLNACAKLTDKQNGRGLHAEIVRRGLEGDFLLGSTLVHMYAKCGLLAYAQEVFDELDGRDAITWTSLITGYAKLGHSEQVLICFNQMQTEGLCPNPLTFVSSLKACACLGVVEKGQLMHAEIARRGLIESDAFIGNAVIDMYAKCGLVRKAQDVFDELPTRDLVSWNALITGYAHIGDSDKAFQCFKQMQVEEVSPDAVTLVTNLKACSNAGNPDIGQELYVECVMRGFWQGSLLVGNALVDMYASCGLLTDAQKVFDSLNSRDTIVWTALIAGYTKFGFAKEALDRYQQMQLKGVTPDVVTHICSLKACASLGEICKGQDIHSEIDRLQLLERYTNVGTALIDMYASCGLLARSKELFDKLPARDVDSWNMLMLGYVMHGYGEEMLKCFERMSAENVSPDVNTIIYVSKACGFVRDIGKGVEIHSEIIKERLLEASDDIGTALSDMHFSCGSLTDAQFVFDKLPVQKLGSWNVLISGYINHGLYYEALKCFDQMLQGPVFPDLCTYACGLKACGSIKLEDECRQLHAEIVKKGLLNSGNSSRAPTVQTTVLWNAVISAYLNLEHGDEALNCCKHMQEEGISFDVVTYVSSLKACGIAVAPDAGQHIHIHIIKLGLLENDILIGTALVDMYATFSMFAESNDVFNSLLVRDIVTWNALILGHVKEGCKTMVLECLERMKLEGILPNIVTYVCTLNACGNRGALKRGQFIHAHVSGESLETDSVKNALVSMYAKCGLSREAHDILRRVQVHDVSWWNALISGCIRDDLGEEALSFYEEMQCQGVVPDTITFVCSLKACSSTGQVTKGRKMHMVIIKRGLLGKEFLIGNALIDMYAKCGLLAEAQKVFDTLPARDTVAWNSLIAGNVINDCGDGALMLSKQMCRECVPFDVASYLCSLKACGNTGDADYGLMLHTEIVKKGLLEWSLFTGNALIDMYVCCGLLVEAQDALQKLVFRDVVSWTTLIAGFLRRGCDRAALLCLQKMQQEGIPSDVLMWNALIAGYSHLGEAEKAFHILESMQGIKPNEESFQSIFAACSHAGLVERARHTVG